MNSIQWMFMVMLPVTFTNQLSHSSYNILILTSPLASQSHSIYFDAIARQLASRGHQVSHYCVGNMGNNTIGLTNYELKFVHLSNYKLFFEVVSIVNAFQFTLELYSTISDAVNMIYSEPLIRDLISEPLHPVTRKPKYDVLLVDWFHGEIYLPLANHIGVPCIEVSSFMLLPSLAWHINVPYHMFLNVRALPDSMSILARERNSLVISTINIIFNMISRNIEEQVRTFLPSSPPIFQLLRNLSLTITAKSIAFGGSMPSTPLSINIGCVQCRPAKPLPQELEDVMQRSGEHGIIYFSLGSSVNSSWTPTGFESKVVNVLSRLNQTIVWKGRLNETYPPNFYVCDWLPQQDLLGHPKLHLMITHGGLGTMHEASYHSCPVLGFPLSVEHRYNIHLASTAGYAEFLDWRTFTEDDLLQSLTRILTNKTYKENALRASIRMKDVLDSPAEQAAYWTEYIVRHKGAPFLKSEAYHLYWYQYFLLDVFAVLIAITAIALTLCLLTLKFVWKIISRYI